MFKHYSGQRAIRSSFGRLSTNFDPHKVKEEWVISDVEINSTPNFTASLKQRLEGTKIRVIEYAPYVFENIRIMDDINIQEIISSIEPENNNDCIKQTTDNISGRGGKFIYFTYDQKYVIKGISQQEKELLVGKLLRVYN